MKITKLELFSKNLQEQLAFYRDILGLEVMHSEDDFFKVRAGYSVLRFTYRENATPYHFAFHIPAYQEEKALEWLKERVAILKDGEDEIIDFSSWNARSVYFYDGDNNIVEFIARRHLHNTNLEIFSSESILGISEIGLSTTVIEEKYRFLNAFCELEKYSGSMDVFCAIGDDDGLMITIDSRKKDWFPTSDKACISDFNCTFTHQEREFSLVFKGNVLMNLKKASAGRNKKYS